ncbi:hypothetical protein [Hymenobacter sp. APR13]|uniref:hypothetical protein n=1 Tax=Hymenobacter sp. APR13 TaxID=1356852 RepID=UPI0004E0A687|nr:hypothetical protein [Hymenobacter sp. APR13]AII50966.1 hypothetical protein N008_03080 [Hymenobacter sp. APR13]
MLRNPFTWLLFFIAATALAACCGSVACDCQDSLDDAVSFSFNQTPGTARPFTLEELDSVFFVRALRRDTARRPIIDTVLLVRIAEQRGSNVVLNNAQPFGQRGTRKLDQYRYQLYLGKRRAPTVRFAIDSVQLSSRLQSDGCCTCNNNTLKRVFLNGNPQPIDATDPSGQDKAVPVVLTR